MTTLPERSPHPQESPERRLSAQEFERVIRRAAEIQSAQGSGRGGSLTEAEALRIGLGLGLSATSLHRALDEASATPARTAPLTRWLGPEIVRAGRTLRGERAHIARTLERYLVEREFLVVLRRLGDCVVFKRAVGVPAGVKRAASRIMSRSAPLAVTTLEMTVHQLDETTSYLALSTAVASPRAGAIAGGAAGIGTGSVTAAVLLAFGVAAEAALLAVPIFGIGIAAGGRAHRLRDSQRVQVQLESLLDRVEHGDLPPPRLPWTFSRWSAPDRTPGASRG